MGGVRQVVDREDQRLREAPVLFLVLAAYFLISSRILRLESGEVIFALDLAAVELALVLEEVELSSRRSRDRRCSTCSPSLRKTPVHADVGLDRHDVVVDEVALADGALVLVAVDDVLEVRRRVRGRRRGQADLDRVEVVERRSARRTPPWPV